MNIKKEITKESLFKILLKILSIVILTIPLSILLVLFVKSIPAIKEFGFTFLTKSTWDPVKGVFGGLPFLIGTLLTTIIATIITIPFSISIALITGEYLKNHAINTGLKSTIELLAGIPSVIYGFWGLTVLAPFIGSIEIFIGVIPYGVGILTASIILCIMIIPYSSSIARESIQLVDQDLKEAAYSLGATKFEVIKYVTIPTAKSGIIAGIFLAFGRAIGETMAVTMVIGNSNRLTLNIFNPSNTIASIIANEFPEAIESFHISSLIELGLLLFIVSTLVNIIGRIIISKTSFGMKE